MVLALIHHDPHSAVWQFTPLAKALLFTMGGCIILFNLAILRIVTLLSASRTNGPRRRSRSSSVGTHLLVVLGSGGHTSEMLSMLSRAHISPSLYTHRTYVVSSGDGFSALKAKVFEETLAESSASRKKTGSYDIEIVPRARKIHQSLLTTPISAIACLVSSIKLLYYHTNGYPDLIVTNGPGTGVIVIAASLILRFFGVSSKIKHLNNIQLGKAPSEGGEGGQMRTIFVESWARVKTLSFSGKILLPIVDRFLVQWKGLEGLGDRAEYVGFLI